MGTHSVVRRAVIEYSIYRHFRKNTKEISPSKFLKKAMKFNGLDLQLTNAERSKFIQLVSRMFEARNIISWYRDEYSRRPKKFYKKVFGFPPRDNQSLSILWKPFSIHFLIEKNDLISFWRKLGCGGGSGAYFSSGDTDIKIPELRGLVSLGRNGHRFDTLDTAKHESWHAYEDYVKRRRMPCNAKKVLYFSMECELNAYLHNFTYSKNKKKRKINKKCRQGLNKTVREFVNEHFRMEYTRKMISKLKKEHRRAKTKKAKKEIKRKIGSIVLRLEWKKAKTNELIKKYRRTKKEVRKALKTVPVGVLRPIISETPYKKLERKLPQVIQAYRRMKRS